MLLSSSKLSSYHELNNIDIDLRVGSTSLERASSAKLLGTHIDHNLKWEEMSSKFQLLLSHSRNLKEIEEFSAISYSQAVSSGDSTFQPSCYI